MILSCIDPHTHALVGLRESHFFVKTNGVTVGQDGVLVKTLILFLKLSGNFPADALTLVIGVYAEVRIVDYQVTVRKRVS